MAQVAQGIDPGAERKEAKAADRKRDDTVERLASAFLSHYAKRVRAPTWAQAESIFRREVLPRWRERLVGDIDRKDVKELLRTIGETRPIAANRAQAYLSRFFRWLMNEDYIAGSPVIGIERAKETARDRALSDHEIRTFWAATNELPAPFGAVYKLLLLTGARCQEICGLRWSEIDLTQKVWLLPAARSKTKVANLLPLGPMAWSIIEAQPRNGSEYVFGRQRTNLYRIKEKLDAAMQPQAPWVTHDLRRSARSLMARARDDSEIAERMIGHLPHGIVRVYNVFDYTDEKRDGFTRLEREIDLIINPPAADVIAFRA
jgi:integrase